MTITKATPGYRAAIREALRRMGIEDAALEQATDYLAACVESGSTLVISAEGGVEILEKGGGGTN